MVGSKNAAAMVAVRDLQVARTFYEQTLGLTAIQEDAPDAVIYRSGDSIVIAYESQYAGTNRATAVSWAVGDDFDATVEDLRSKSVSFEHYDDLPGTTRDGDVHSTGDLKSVWFKDPDGNILSLVNVAM